MIVDRFKNVVKNFPKKTCIVDDNNLDLITYQQLYDASLKIAKQLKINGVKKGDFVTVELSNSWKYFASRFAIWELGAVFVALSDKTPKNRLHYICDDCKPKFNIDINFIDRCLKQQDKLLEEEIFSDITDTDKCMIIYTSGTSGKPKGVLHTYYALDKMLERNSSVYCFSSEDKHAAFASTEFIASILIDMYFLFIGQTIYIVPLECKHDANKLQKFITANKINNMYIFSSVLKYLNLENTDIKNIIIGGAKAERVYSSKYNIINAYGSTEAGIFSFFNIDKLYDEVPIGVCPTREKLYILDSNMQPANEGEMYFAGYMAHSYLNQDDKTKQAFISNPFYKEDGFSRLYRTGDIGKRDKNNNILFVDRLDMMVKINGQRVEPGEIEFAVKKFPGIDDACVKSFNAEDSAFLVCYYCSKNNITKDEFDCHLKSYLPKYMIPAFYVKLDSIPKNNNGKIDYSTLKNPKKTLTRNKYIAPKNSLEKEVCVAFSKVLDFDNIGVDDDFVALGGDSIAAIALISELSNYNITTSDILKLKTPRLLAANCSKYEEIDYEKILNSNTSLCLSEQQLNVYLDIVANENSSAYNIPLKINLSNYCSQDIHTALKKIFKIHPVLTFCIDKDNPEHLKGGIYPRVNIGKNVDDENLNKFLYSDFDLYSSLCRFLIDETNNYLYAVFHHLIFDGFSSKVFYKDLLDILKEKHLDCEYKFIDSSLRFKNLNKTDLFKEANNYFETEFDDPDNISEPLLDVEENTPSFCSISLDVDKNSVNNFVKNYNISKNILFTSAFALTLSKFSNSNFAYFSLIDNGRDSIKAHGSIGMFVNTLPILINCNFDKVKDFIFECSQNIFSTLNYSFYPFRLFHANFGLNNNIDFQYMPNTHEQMQVGFNGSLNVEDVSGRKNFISNLSFVLADNEDLFKLMATSNGKYSKNTVQRILQCMNTVLNSILTFENFSDFNYVNKEDIETFNKLNNTENTLKEVDILHSFNNSCKRNPNAVLIKYNNFKITYAQGAQIIQEISHKLKDVCEETHISIMIPRSSLYLLTSLAVLNKNCVYVPIDDALPDTRIKYIIEDSASQIVIVTDETLSRVKQIIKNVKTAPKILNIENIIDVSTVKNYDNSKFSQLKVNYQTNSPAIILYTSGTTGNPKGCLITRKAIVNFAYWLKNKLKLTCSDVYGMYTTFGFDAHGMALYPIIVAGGTLDVIPSDIKLNIDLLHDYFTKHNITHTFLTTQIGKIYANKYSNSNLKSLFVGGEYLGNVDFSLQYDFYDGYGPTENFIFTTSILVKDKIDSSSIGFALDNTKLYVLDSKRKRLPFGCPGELYISGAQVAQKYLNRDDINKKTFFNNPFDGDNNTYSIMYKTGDIVRFLPDGSIGFIGRCDSQVKIRGNRVELGEVEACIRGVPGVDDCTVQAIKNNGGYELVAYIVSAKNNIENCIKEYLTSNKPSYMMPASFIFMDKIPLNINGKVNKSKLPKPSLNAYKVEYTPPSNEKEKLLCDAYVKVLGREKVGVNDDFFSLGGDSLKAIQLQSMVSNITYADVLKYKTPKEIVANCFNQDKNEIIYNEKSGCPLTQRQLDFYYDISLNRVNYDYINFGQINLLKKCCEKEIRELLNILFNKYPVFKARLIINDYEPWLMFDAKISIKKGHEPEDFSTENALCSFSFTEDKIFYKVHHLIVDAYSLQILNDVVLSILNGEEIKYDDGIFANSSFYTQLFEQEENSKAIKFLDDYYKNKSNSQYSTFTYPLASGFQTYYKKLNVNNDKIKNWVNSHSININYLYLTAYIFTLFKINNSKEIQIMFTDNGRKKFDLHNSICFYAKNIILNAKYLEGNILNYLKELANNYEQLAINSELNMWDIRTRYNIKDQFYFQYLPINVDIDYIKDGYIEYVGENRGLTIFLRLINQSLYISTGISIFQNIDNAKNFCSLYEAVLNQIYLKDTFDEIELGKFSPVCDLFSSVNFPIVYDKKETLTAVIKAFKNNLDIDKCSEKLSFRLCNGSKEQAENIFDELLIQFPNTFIRPIDIIWFDTPEEISNYLCFGKKEN